MYGAQIINDAGIVQLDDQSVLFQYVTKGNINNNDWVFANSEGRGIWYYPKPSITGLINPVFAIHFDYGPNINPYSRTIGGVSENYFWISSVNTTGANKPVANFEYFVFDQPTQITSAYGLVLYNAQGAYAFSCDQKLMNLKDMYSNLSLPTSKYACAYPMGLISTYSETVNTNTDLTFTTVWTQSLEGFTVSNTGGSYYQAFLNGGVTNASQGPGPASWTNYNDPASSILINSNMPGGTPPLLIIDVSTL